MYGLIISLRYSTRALTVVIYTHTIGHTDLGKDTVWVNMFACKFIANDKVN